MEISGVSCSCCFWVLWITGYLKTQPQKVEKVKLFLFHILKGTVYPKVKMPSFFQAIIMETESFKLLIRKSIVTNAVNVCRQNKS